MNVNSKCHPFLEIIKCQENSHNLKEDQFNTMISITKQLLTIHLNAPIIIRKIFQLFVTSNFYV